MVYSTGYRVGLSYNLFCVVKLRTVTAARLTMADYDDVTWSLYRDVGGHMIDMTPELTSASDQMTAGCELYKFIVDMVNGLVCVLGFIGNLIAFVVFHKDTMKTSTSFLFQVGDPSLSSDSEERESRQVHPSSGTAVYPHMPTYAHTPRSLSYKQNVALTSLSLGLQARLGSFQFYL